MSIKQHSTFMAEPVNGFSNMGLYENIFLGKLIKKPSYGFSVVGVKRNFKKYQTWQ